MAEGKAGRFHGYIATGNILCGLASRDSFGAISELAGVMARNTAGLNRGEMERLVLERERLFPTVVAPGLAVPHARMKGLSGPLVAVGTSEQGVDFKTGGEPVNVVILVLTPKESPSLHLQILSALAKDFKSPDLLRRLRDAKTQQEVADAFGEGSSQSIPDYLIARDIMRKDDLVVLSESDTLSDAIGIFATKGIFDIPIVDEDKDIRGMLSMEDVLRLSLPEHLLWMDDLSPILEFQPFAELLRNERETKLADVMREDYVSVDAGVPAIQVAKIFIVKSARLILVTENGKFAGTVRIQEFIRRFFWE